MRQNSEQQREESYCPWTSRVLPAVQQHSLPLHAVPISSQSYVQNVKQIGTFASMEQSGATCTSLESGRAQDFYLIKEGIKPGWEDDANKNVGK